MADLNNQVCADGNQFKDPNCETANKLFACTLTVTVPK